MNELLLANLQVSRAKQNPSRIDRTWDAMDSEESVLFKSEDMEERVKAGTVLLHENKESRNMLLTAAQVGRESYQDSDESSFWVAVVQDVASGRTTFATEHDLKDHDFVPSCPSIYEALNLDDGQSDDTQPCQGTQVTIHHYRCPTALMDTTFAGKPSAREIAFMNGATLANYLFSPYLQKSPEKARTHHLVVSEESVVCTEDTSIKGSEKAKQGS
jgi:hypothetical protein